MAVTCKTILAALASTLLAISMLGCGQTNNLKTINLTATEINGVPPTSQSGFVTLQGNGGTIQLAATGNYSDDKTKDLSKVVTWTAIVDPQYSLDAFGNTLEPPCSAPCQTAGQGTVEYSQTGLITAVSPATCTWIDSAPLNPTTGQPQTPVWFYVGDYVVTATYLGITSQPIYIPIASSSGNTIYNGQVNNPDAFCDSGSY